MKTIILTIFYILVFITIIGIIATVIAIPIYMRMLIKRLKDTKSSLCFPTIINPFMIMGVSGKKYNEVEPEYKFLWILNKISNISLAVIITAIILALVFLVLKLCNKTFVFI